VVAVVALALNLVAVVMRATTMMVEGEGMAEVVEAAKVKEAEAAGSRDVQAAEVVVCGRRGQHRREEKRRRRRRLWWTSSRWRRG
jgi:hypothetical protein